MLDRNFRRLFNRLENLRCNLFLPFFRWNIFGSQIRLLEFLSIQGEGKAAVQTVTQFFDAAKHNNPDIYESQQFSDYMAFLLSWGLVKNENDEWAVTTQGRAFITYITAMQLTKNKAF